MYAPLIRPADRIIAGVCSGLAAHLGLSVKVVRISMAVLTLASGAGLLLYAWLWLLVPTADEAARADNAAFNPRNIAGNFARNFGGPRPAVMPTPSGPQPGTGVPPRQRPAGNPAATAGAAAGPSGRTRTAELMQRGGWEIAIGAALVLAGGAFVAQLAGFNVPWETWLPMLAIVTGAVLAWMQLDNSRRSGIMDRAGATGAQGLVRLIAGLVFVVVGIFILISGSISWDVMWPTLLATLAVLAGVGLVLAPWVVKYWTDLEAERSGRIRETERAEIAAHLHDSVLQTLALIQNRAASEQDVTRLARAQERELREWLYRDKRKEEGNLVDRIKAVAAEIEDAYGHPIDVVAVGDTPLTEQHEALIHATREAVQNAAKHAGGSISVYLEKTPGSTDVFVRDRGPGFDLANVPADRLGVRESLIRRMERHGGEARIRNTGNGTEVHLSLKHPEEGNHS
ncbi:ATP-binding protein [Arthrobacter crystallopoietes]|uniref:ATP-binding protein n=1 Tax=Crystallibacter crystallopoietes TaxID=37928 RepID=UPI00111116AA|nr:ATP-binding protein [Arthrobacter crystallopoietes]QTG80889.1 PspC domain-containing protein [Arthrobacter crystallopoietes]